MQQMSRRYVAFLAVVWAGQLITLTGSGLTTFALGVWVYQTTGSVTEYALISVFTFLPTVIVSPFSGVLVDRWDRRWAMMLSEAGGALSILAIVLLLYAGRLAIWHIYIATAANSIFRSFSWPAFMASITLMVPKKHLARASGFVQSAEAAGRIISPLLAALLLVIIQIQGVVVLDFLSFVFAVGTLMIVRFPRPEPAAEEEREERGSMIREAIFGWNYITARAGLFALLIFFSLLNFCASIVEVLLTPLVLSFAKPTVLGSVLSASSIGLLAGSVLVSIWGGPKRHFLGIFWFTILMSGLLFLDGLQANALLIGAATLGYLFCGPIINACSQAIWQRKVSPGVQGRVFTIRGTIALSSMPLAYLVAGPLADKIFNPLLLPQGPLANSIGQVIGVGPGRGIGLLFMVLAILNVIFAIGAYLYPHLRLVEDELPDAVPDEVPAYT
jgi:MFS transporter, DHA3 family, macrolide efflux protein